MTDSPIEKRFALLVEYDGTDFHGSQFQDGVRTVQGEIEGGLAQIYGRPIRLRLAGRTDAGVHATGQVAVFDGEERLDGATLRKALNFHTGNDVAVREVETVDSGFDPRRAALRRTYVYSLSDGPVGSPLRRRTEVHIGRPLDVGLMRQAAEWLVGSHDFASFAGPAAEPGAVTVRMMFGIEIDRDGDRVSLRITGNAFLHQQVRRMATALVRVGTGEKGTGHTRDLVENPRKGSAKAALDPKGLCLAWIDYGPGGPFASASDYN
jgi:tRNA pseudouridine38-40 synthase